MPKFRFNKLVRDKLPEEYAKLHQDIMSRHLVGTELLKALRAKLAEEAVEIPLETGTHAEIVEEIGDLEQVLVDMKQAVGVTDEEVTAARQKKFAKKGGFSQGVFVESIELQDGDEWVDYYRKDPDKYPEES